MARDGIDPDKTFPATQYKGPEGGRTRHGKKILEIGFSQPGFLEGGGSLTPENILDGAPMKDEPHPNTGPDVFGDY